jgi:hypothetical protein
MIEHDRAEQIINQLERVSSYGAFIDELQNSTIVGYTLIEKATDLLRAITDFLRKSLIYLQTHSVANLGKVVVGSENVPLMDTDLEEAIREFNWAVSQETLRITSKREEVRQTQELLTWLSTLDFKPKQSDVLGRRLEGTGKWVLEDPQFRRWVDGDITTLWCPGARKQFRPIQLDRHSSTDSMGQPELGRPTLREPN